MNNSIAALGRKLSDTTIQLHEAIAAAAGLSSTDHKYLYLVVDHGPLTAGELAEKARLTTGAATGIIDRLEKRKLVKRVFDKTDRRKVKVQANADTVAKLLTPLSAKLQQKIEKLINTYSIQEQEIIEQYLNESIITMQEFTQDIYQTKTS